ncbi:MAG: PepSY domain-containing protein [Planctomycetota bacterium]|nr:PepSY domain-containing protein [Planctomycetota bacterium]
MSFSKKAFFRNTQGNSLYKVINRWFRKLHRWGAVGFAVPLLLVVITGLMLQVKKQWTWVQPPTQRGQFDSRIDLQAILEIAKSDINAEVESWEDVDRLDVRPAKGIVKLQSQNNYEVQIDLNSRKILQSQYRRSDWIESLHDGSFFGDWAKLSIFLVNGIVLLALWFKGVYFWYLPYLAKSRKKKKQETSD